MKPIGGLVAEFARDGAFECAGDLGDTWAARTMEHLFLNLFPEELTADQSVALAAIGHTTLTQVLDGELRLPGVLEFERGQETVHAELSESADPLQAVLGLVGRVHLGFCALVQEQLRFRSRLLMLRWPGQDGDAQA